MGRMVRVGVWWMGVGASKGVESVLIFGDG